MGRVKELWYEQCMKKAEELVAHGCDEEEAWRIATDADMQDRGDYMANLASERELDNGQETVKT